LPESWNGLREQIERHERDLYRGNGLPGLTTRIQIVEGRMERFEKWLTDSDKRREVKQNLILGGIITLAAGLLLAHLKLI
jgi:hypothetical protein